MMNQPLWTRAEFPADHNAAKVAAVAGRPQTEDKTQIIRDKKRGAAIPERSIIAV
jgi:hypothetical protein